MTVRRLLRALAQSGTEPRRCLAGWEVLTLKAVVNRERKGRWLVLVARRVR